MSVYRPEGSKTLWVRYRGPVDEQHPRGDYRVNTRTNDEKRAKAFLAEELRKVGNHNAGESSYVAPDRQRVTLGVLLDAKVAHDEEHGKKGIRQLRCKVAHVKRLLGGAKANELRTNKLTWYVKTRRAEAAAVLVDGKPGTIAPATLDRELETIRPAYKLAGLLHLCPEIERLCKVGTNARQGFIEPAEHARILQELPSDVLRDVCQWAWLTGSRRGEILSLTWACYSESDGMIRLEASKTKTAKARKYPVEGGLLEVLRRRKAARCSTSPAELIFHSEEGRRLGDFFNTFERACTRAGVQGRTFHDYRRSAIRQMNLAGVPRHVIKAFSGHTTDEVFNRYCIGSDQELRDALAKREALDAASVKEGGKRLDFRQ